MNTLSLPKLLALLCVVHAALQTQGQSRPFKTDSIVSTILNETRELRVIVPEDAKPDSKYEVVYICDGEWYQELVPDTYSFAQSAGFTPKAIFVLMRNRYLNGHNLRDRDFSPVNVGDSLTGGAARFYDFVTKEVAPFVEKKYPANGRRTLVGSSFSGLFTVYAYMKDPHFFQSFVASDPNVGFGNDHVAGMAAKSVASFDDAAGTLFIGGLPQTYRGMGIYTFDSVMRANAPKGIKYKFVAYDNETHYSVQLKAFYDAFRFSHFGFGSASPEFHPRNGIVEDKKSFYVYSLNNNPAAHFTTDGSQPTLESPLMKRDTTITLTVPGKVRVAALANRQEYSKSWEANYEKGIFAASKKAGKPGLQYTFYEGKWDSFPSAKTSATSTGVVDSTFKLAGVMKTPGYITIEGNLDVAGDLAYVFYTNGYNQVQLTVDERLLLNEKVPSGDPYTSVIVSLAKGSHKFKLRMLKNSESEPHFTIFRSAGNDKWWENLVSQY